MLHKDRESCRTLPSPALPAFLILRSSWRMQVAYLHPMKLRACGAVPGGDGADLFRKGSPERGPIATYSPKNDNYRFYQLSLIPYILPYEQLEPTCVRSLLYQESRATAAIALLVDLLPLPELPTHDSAHYSEKAEAGRNCCVGI